MRLFAAIELPKEIKDYLFQLEKTLKRELPAKIAWVHKKNLHITLKFLGDIKEEEAAVVMANLDLVKIEPFELTLNEVGVFPHESNPKSFWVGLTPEKPLIKLQQAVDEETMKFTPTSAEFTAHMTIGRVKALPKSKKLEFQNKLKEIRIKPMKFEVDSFQLIKSQLTKDGPKYKVLEEYN
jgi:RNA 2',3'-cyclic 3'-phosphodiesterase